MKRREASVRRHAKLGGIKEDMAAYYFAAILRLITHHSSLIPHHFLFAINRYCDEYFRDEYFRDEYFPIISDSQIYFSIF